MPLDCGDIACEECKHYEYCAKGPEVYTAELRDGPVLDELTHPV